MKDIFISHASEDKEELIRPLVEELKQYGVDMWYDEFELKVGDSLSASIDYGLSNSKYGLIVLSPNFLAKKWTDYELRSLLTREIHSGKTILPIWHNISLEQVMERSLYLADKKAICSDIGIKNMAFEIVKVVRPDIMSFWTLHKAYQEVQKNGRMEYIHHSNIIPNERIHQSLPFHMVISSLMFESMFPDLCSFPEMIDGFMRDVDYDTEFIVWVIISCSYIELVKELNLPLSDGRCRDVFKSLLAISMGGEVAESVNNIVQGVNVKQMMLQIYNRNAIFVEKILENE